MVPDVHETAPKRVSVDSSLQTALSIAFYKRKAQHPYRRNEQSRQEVVVVGRLEFIQILP
jgi:hypothetical protein